MLHSPFIVLFFLLSISSTVTGAQCNALYELDGMFKCRTAKSFDNYRNYGCSCSGWAPDKPLDGIDKCCEVHNDCYAYLTNSKRCQNSNAPFFCFYSWECMDQYPACNDDNKCLQSVCQCDEQFINCLAKYPYPNYVKKCPYFDGDPIMKHLSTLAPSSS